MVDATHNWPIIKGYVGTRSQKITTKAPQHLQWYAANKDGLPQACMVKKNQQTDFMKLSKILCTQPAILKVIQGQADKLDDAQQKKTDYPDHTTQQA